MTTRTKAKAAPTPEKFGLSITGSLRVFSKSKAVDVKGKTVSITDYWTNFSRKEENGDYTNVALKVIFKKDLDTPEHNSVIKVNGFITVSGNKDYERLALLVQGWDYVD